MTAKLELHHEGEIIVVQAADAVMGRRSDCELRVIHPLVSRQHCRFELRPGGVRLVDLGSANGTYVNQERVTGAVDLRANDWVRIGTQGPQFQLLRAEVDGEDVSGWDPQAMQETMVSAAPPFTNFTVRVSVGPHARAEPDDLSERSTPSAVTRQPDTSSSIPVVGPLETGSQEMRSSDVLIPPPGQTDEYGPVLIEPEDLDAAFQPDEPVVWSDTAEVSSAIETGSLGPTAGAPGHAVEDPRDLETGSLDHPSADETVAPASAPRPGPAAAPPPQPPPQARPQRPPAAPAAPPPAPPPALGRTERPPDWPTAAPAAPPNGGTRPATAGDSARSRRRWGALTAGFVVGLLVALAGVAAAAALTPLDEKLHRLVPGARVIELPEEWR